jgi:hypothetical protein
MTVEWVLVYATSPSHITGYSRQANTLGSIPERVTVARVVVLVRRDGDDHGGAGSDNGGNLETVHCEKTVKTEWVRETKNDREASQLDEPMSR